MKIRNKEYDENITIRELCEDLKIRGEFEDFAELNRYNKEQEQTAQDLIDSLEEKNDK